MSQKTQEFEILRLQSKDTNVDSGTGEYMITGNAPHADKHFFIEEQLDEEDDESDCGYQQAPKRQVIDRGA